jgi:hypothetical protein
VEYYFLILILNFMMNHNSNSVNINPAKRIAAFSERIRNTLKHTAFNNIEDEKTYLNKLEITESNIAKIIEHKNETFQQLLEAKDKQLEDANRYLQELEDTSEGLRKDVIDLDNRCIELGNDMQKHNDLKVRLSADIIKLRKENTKGFENLLVCKQRQDIDIKGIKSELSMMLNMLKLRILNLDMPNDPSHVGYVMNTSDNTLCYLNVDKNQDDIEKGKIYWTAMNGLIVEKNTLTNSIMN